MSQIRKLWNDPPLDYISYQGRLMIEIVSACNVKCGFCPMQSQKKIKFSTMQLDQFRYIIEENSDYIKKEFSGVEPYFRGEALLHKDFWGICEVLRKNGVKNYGINSNLSIKNIEFEKFKEYEVPLLVNMGGVTKAVHESVMKGSDFDLVCENLRKLIDLGVAFDVKINPTRRNIHEFEKLPDLIESFGGRREQVKTYSTCYPLPALAPETEKKIFFEEVVSKEVEPYLRFTYDLNIPGYDIRAKKPGCHFLIDTIFFDGQMTICCHDQLQMINVGNVFQTPLKEIRSSAQYIEAVEKGKRGEHSICPGCN